MELYIYGRDSYRGGGLSASTMHWTDDFSKIVDYALENNWRWISDLKVESILARMPKIYTCEPDGKLVLIKRAITKQKLQELMDADHPCFITYATKILENL
jgi:hypothetical protein